MPPAGGAGGRDGGPLTAGAVALVLASAGLHAFWNWLVADARDSHAVGAVALLTAAIVFAPVAALTWDVDAAAWPYIAASAALELAYFALLAAAYERADLSFVYPIARGAAPVLVLIVSLAALGADLSAGEAAGVLAIAAGVLLVRGVGERRRARRSAHGARRRGLHRRLHAGRRRGRPPRRRPVATSRRCC